MSDNTITVELRNVSKEYTAGDRIVDNISMKFEPRTINVLMGKSGSGKSTLLNMIGTLDKPTQGSVLINGKDVSDIRERDLAILRNRNIGFIFQAYNLLQNLTAEQNVFIAMLFSGRSLKEKKKTAEDALRSLGLEKHLRSYPKQLSGGEQQRVAIARALSNSPGLVIADEPTANVDEATAKLIFDRFRELKESGRTVIIATHDPDYKEIADNVYYMKDGSLERGEQ